MKEYSKQELKDALLDIGLIRGDTLLIHSALFRLGIINCTEVKDILNTIYTIIKDIIGDSGTIVVPTFTFGFSSGEDFDIENTASKNMGNFSEYIRTHEASVRSKHPIQSVSALGDKAKWICELNSYSGFGKDSPFARLLEASGKILLLGRPVSTSFVHLLEEYNQVPYRFWKEFSGNYIKDGLCEYKTYGLFVRDHATNPQIQLKKIESVLTLAGKVKSCKLGGGMVHSINTKDYFEVVNEKLQKDPYFCVSEV